MSSEDVDFDQEYDDNDIFSEDDPWFEYLEILDDEVE